METVRNFLEPSLHGGRFESLENIEFLEPLDILIQIESIRNLKDGWLDGEGKAPSHVALTWFVQTFDRYWVDPLPLPYIYPTYEGGISLEWSIGYWELSLDIDLTSHTGYWHALHTENNQANEKDLNLEKEEDWNFLIQQIKPKE
jgi:hypothetical protein